ncbi:MAG: DJ-1/PfpI family protein [Patescibacteria group bacterium]|jgi:protease I|nr:DJ-1/PfpI family protein [Patescibacteria group bacterium]
MAKKAVFIIAQNNFRDEELLDTKAVLTGRKIEAKVAAKTRNKALGKLGTEIKPDLAIAEINPNDFDAIVFIGGRGAEQYFDDQEVFKLAEKFFRGGKLVGAICIAPSILANAGVLIGKTVTAFPTEEENLRDRGAEYTGMQVEVDGKIVTAKDPTAAKEFGEKLAYLLEG